MSNQRWSMIGFLLRHALCLSAILLRRKSLHACAMLVASLRMCLESTLRVGAY
uniref:Uncharacterized protein n=1 Tax=Arundo donax TaxID=35708 RepID=A0A0A9QBY1_ARUDO